MVQDGRICRCTHADALCYAVTGLAARHDQRRDKRRAERRGTGNLLAGEQALTRHVSMPPIKMSLPAASTGVMHLSTAWCVCARMVQAVLSLPGILDHPELAKIVGFDRYALAFPSLNSLTPRVHSAAAAVSEPSEADCARLLV